MLDVMLGWKIRICRVKEKLVSPNQCCCQTQSYSHCIQFTKRRGQRAHDLQVLVDAVGVPVDGTGWSGLCGRSGRSRSFGRRSRSFGCKLWRWRWSVQLFPSALVVAVIAVDLALHHAVLAHHHHLRWSLGNAPAVFTGTTTNEQRDAETLHLPSFSSCLLLSHTGVLSKTGWHTHTHTLVRACISELCLEPPPVSQTPKKEAIPKSVNRQLVNSEVTLFNKTQTV